MTIYNIIIRENGHDIFTVTQSPSEKYVSFDLGANSAYVSTYVWTLLNQNSILPSAAAADLMDLAIAIYTSDQIISREINGFQGWSRHIKIHFPVSDLIVWNGVKSELELMLSFLSGDKWEIIFRDRTIPRNIQPPLIRNPEGITKVSLLSGG